jgi:hypothetical protein
VDLSSISLEVAKLIAPALPVLVTGREAALKAFAGEIGKEAWQKVSGCWQALKSALGNDTTSQAEMAEISTLTKEDERIRRLAKLLERSLPSVTPNAKLQIAKFITNVGYMTNTHIGDNYGNVDDQTK